MTTPKKDAKDLVDLLTQLIPAEQLNKYGNTSKESASVLFGHVMKMFGEELSEHEKKYLQKVKQEIEKP